MRIIPAIDIYEGKCVRLLKGDKNKAKVYFEDPLEAGVFLKENGFLKLHVVDLDGAFKGEISNLKKVLEIKKKLNIKIQYGGGIRSIKKAEDILETGIDQIIIGTMAIKDKEAIKYLIDKYQERIIVSLDVMNEYVAIKGWEENSKILLDDALSELIDFGLKYVLITDIDKDGTLEGPNVELYKKILKNYKINLIASGGVGSTKDLRLLDESGIDDVVIGKAIYEKKIDLNEVKKC